MHVRLEIIKLIQSNSHNLNDTIVLQGDDHLDPLSLFCQSSANFLWQSKDVFLSLSVFVIMIINGLISQSQIQNGSEIRSTEKVFVSPLTDWHTHKILLVSSVNCRLIRVGKRTIFRFLDNSNKEGNMLIGIIIHWLQLYSWTAVDFENISMGTMATWIKGSKLIDSLKSH